ncbi:Rossmann-fold NAD(P)-binding domain-containing protein [Flexibacterium corallicola]|uniref:hypothetical protein n=1 Tax=Flexibacterium corallicola TaxID=3037259 RepID=UPI00286FA252|nr:hypothetical protein [Pseudovibrio sp. M1P-2-3]
MKKVCLVGLASKGRELMLSLVQAGYEVVATDLDPERVAWINASQTEEGHWGNPELLAKYKGVIRATTDIRSSVASSDMTFITMPSKPSEKNPFRLEELLHCLTEIGRGISTGGREHVVVNCMPVPPGSSQNVLRKTLERESKRFIGPDLGFCFLPLPSGAGDTLAILNGELACIIGSGHVDGFERTKGVLEALTPAMSQFTSLSFVDAELYAIAVEAAFAQRLAFSNILSEVCEAYPGADEWWIQKALQADERSSWPAPLGFGRMETKQANMGFTFLCSANACPSQLPTAASCVDHHQVGRLYRTVVEHTPPKGSVGILGLANCESPTDIMANKSISLAQMLEAANFEVELLVESKDLVPSNEALKGLRFSSELTELLLKVQTLILMVPTPEFRALPVSFCRPDTVLIDPWRLLHTHRLPQGMKLIQFGVGREHQTQNNTQSLASLFGNDPALEVG